MTQTYTVTATVTRQPTPAEYRESLRQGTLAAVPDGIISATIEAPTQQEALEKGKTCIVGCLRRGQEAAGFTCRPASEPRPMTEAELTGKTYTATWIAYHRARRGMTQKQLSEASGVNFRQIQKAEGGESRPGNMTAKNFLAIADALGVDPHALL